MTLRTLATRPPRWFSHGPIFLFDHGLGALTGGRLALVQHTGRRSGTARRTVLEVVDRPRPGAFLVVSGAGEASDWVKNVRADPAVVISVGRLDRRPATARVLDRTEVLAALVDLARRRPLAWVVMVPALVPRGRGARPRQRVETPPVCLVEFEVARTRNDTGKSTDAREG